MPRHAPPGHPQISVFQANYVQPVCLQYSLDPAFQKEMVDLLDTKTIATLSFCNNTSSPITVKVYLFHVDENGSYGAGSTDEGHMVDVVVPANGFYDLTPLVGGLTLNTDELLVVQPSATGVISTCSYVRVSHTDALPD